MGQAASGDWAWTDGAQGDGELKSVMAPVRCRGESQHMLKGLRAAWMGR